MNNSVLLYGIEYVESLLLTLDEVSFIFTL